MDAFIITDASFLPRTHAAGVAGKIEADGNSFEFKGAVTNIMNPTHGEMIAVLHSLKKLREVRDKGAMDIDTVHIGTDCKSLITLMTEGYKKGRVYHSTTQRLLKEIDRAAKVMNIDLEFHKIKAHVENNPTLLEKLHNQVDRMAKHAMSTLMNEVELKAKPGKIYTTLLPQTLLPDEYEVLEETAYKLAEKGFSPRVLTTLPIGGNPFEDGLNRYLEDYPSSDLKAELIPTLDSKTSKKIPNYEKGVVGIDRIQVLDALDRLGYADAFMLNEIEGYRLADVGRAIAGNQNKPKEVEESYKLRKGEHSQFILSHSASKRLTEYNLITKQYGALYGVSEKTISEALDNNKSKPEVEYSFG